MRDSSASTNDAWLPFLPHGDAAFLLSVKPLESLTFRHYGKTQTWLHRGIGPLFHLLLGQIFLTELPFWV